MRDVIFSSITPIFFNQPFSVSESTTDNKVWSRGGWLISDSYSKRVEDREIDADEEDFFLRISFSPLSNIYAECTIIGKKELKEIRTKEDDMLNMYIPIGRVRPNGTDVDTVYSFNGNFYTSRSSSLKRMTGFYKEGKLHLSGFVLKNPSNSLIKVLKNNRLETEFKNGDVIYLHLTGTLSKANRNLSFFFDSVNIGGSSEPLFSPHSSIEVDGEEFRAAIDFRYPIGIIQDANYVLLSRGNVKIKVHETSINYFKETREVESGCNEAVYETKNIYSVYPEFV